MKRCRQAASVPSATLSTTGRPRSRPRLTRKLKITAELAQTLTFLANWLTGNQKQILADSFAAFVGHPAYTTTTLCADLHQFTFLLGETDGEELFGQATP